MLSVLGFLIILAPLVIVHEFGHYSFARLFNVKAEVFSIGFGPRIWARLIGETEWRVSAIPLGGFVKLLGEDREAELPPELAARSLGRQAPWKRFFIFFGGPLFNFIFAILIYATMMVVGEPQIASVVARVVEHSPAAQSGLRSGDQVTKIDGEEVTRFDEIAHAINENPGKPLKFEVRRTGSPNPITAVVTPTSQTGFSQYGEKKGVGKVDGLLEMARGTQVGISDPNSAAAKAGFKTGDQVVAFNNQPIESWEQLSDLYAAAPVGAAAKFSVKRANDQAFEATLTKPAAVSSTSPVTPTMDQAWGLHSSELFIEKTVPESPAEKAGIKKGDRLIGVGETDVNSFFELRDAVQKAGESPSHLVPLRWERDGKVITANINPTATTGQDPILTKTTQYTIGVAPMLSLAEPKVVIERTWNPFVLIPKATARMVTFTYRNFVSIGKMFTGDVSVATLGGPILIGKIAGESLTRGLIAFLSTMAILSIGLGVLNILPVPVLDGGHIMLLALETLRKKPFTIRQLEIIQGAGLGLILLLMIVVMKNDISRLPFLSQ